MKSPAFQFYPQDFLVGTAEMSAEEVGGYIRLLCYQWAKGGVPKEESKLLIMTGITSGLSLGNVLVKFRLCDDNLYRNDRLSEISRLKDEYHERQRQNGSKGGNPNFKKGKDNPYYNPKDNQPLSSGDNPKINSSSSSSSSSSYNIYKDTKASKLQKPSIEECTSFAKEIGIPESEGESFYHHHEARGWVLKGGTKMKSWKSSMQTWKSIFKSGKFSNNQNSNQKTAFNKPVINSEEFFKAMGVK